jgi:type I restriction enzyme R subunit
VVRGILADAKQNGIGQTYLIQHSAGSGKSNSITWLAYQLVELYDTAGTANVFDSVVVVTDRRVLDTQLKDNIKLFSETKNIVAHAESRRAEGASGVGQEDHHHHGAEIPVHRGWHRRSDRPQLRRHHRRSPFFAIRQRSDKLNMTLGRKTEVPEDLQDKILAAMKGRKMSQNASYFAFTATPKPATLEKFGRQGPDGKFYPSTCIP